MASGDGIHGGIISQRCESGITIITSNLLFDKAGTTTKKFNPAESPGTKESSAAQSHHYVQNLFGQLEPGYKYLDEHAILRCLISRSTESFVTAISCG